MKSPPGAALHGPAVDLARGSTDGEPVRVPDDIDTGRLLAMTRAELVARIEADGRQHLEPAVIERLTNAELRARLHVRRRRQTE